MSKSRFEKLEGERSEVESGESPDRRIDARFGSDPELGTREADAAGPAAHLQRFDADGGDGLGLDRDPLATLPTLECPQCHHECGKFETACSRCRTSLTDAAARAHNLQRAEALAAARAQERAETEAKRKEEIAELEFQRIRAQETHQGLADELRAKYEGDDRTRGVHWPWVAAAAVCFFAAKVAPWFGLKMLCIAAGTVCLLTRVPGRAWRALAKPSRRFGGW